MASPQNDTVDSFWESSWKGIGPARVAESINSLAMTPDPITRYLSETGAATVCDAGCGCGAYARKLLAFGFSVSGFDLSASAVRLARELLENSGFSPEAFRAADLKDTGYASGQFDAVVARDVLDHMTRKDGAAAAKELLRITAPKGSVLLTLDAADEEYETEPHVVSPDGDYIFTDGKWCGMVFHPYAPESLSALFPGCAIRLLDSSETGFTAAIETEVL